MEMELTPAVFIPQFVQLLQQWANTAFPLPRTPEVAGRLNGAVWGPLMDALCNRRARLLTPFLHETGQLTLGGRGGDPPVQAIESRLNQLVELGLRPIFIVVAARLVIDVSLERYYPDALALWQQRADEIIPLSDINRILFSENKKGGKGTVYGPGIDN